MLAVLALRLNIDDRTGQHSQAKPLSSLSTKLCGSAKGKLVNIGDELENRHPPHIANSEKRLCNAFACVTNSWECFCYTWHSKT